MWCVTVSLYIAAPDWLCLWEVKPSGLYWGGKLEDQKDVYGRDLEVEWKSLCTEAVFLYHLQSPLSLPILFLLSIRVVWHGALIVLCYVLLVSLFCLKLRGVLVFFFYCLCQFFPNSWWIFSASRYSVVHLVLGNLVVIFIFLKLYSKNFRIALFCF